MIELLTYPILVIAFVWILFHHRRSLSKLLTKHQILMIENQRLTYLLEDMEDKEQHDLAQIVLLKKEVSKWKEHWFEQRDATGRSYWTGYRNGSKQNKDNQWHSK